MRFRRSPSGPDGPAGGRLRLVAGLCITGLMMLAGCAGGGGGSAADDQALVDVMEFETGLHGIPYTSPRQEPEPDTVDVADLMPDMPATTVASQPDASRGPRTPLVTPSGRRPAPALEPAAPVEPAPLDLERHYVVGPEAARTLGYRIDWQTNVHPSLDSGIRMVAVQDDSIFTLDGQNFLSRLRRDDGERLWRVAVAEPIHEIQGVTFVPALERVYLTMGGSILVLDAATGSAVARQRLEKIANTAPVLFGGYMIYGSRAGGLVWHSFEIAFRWREHTVANSIRITPVIDNGVVAAVGTNGRVVVLDAGNATQLWSKQVLDRVEAAPAFGDGVLYLAATDQYLYAIDLGTGRTIWRRLTTTPLRHSPTVLDDRVYQQVPGEGLTCFEALPLNAFDGRIQWVAESGGTLLTRRRSDLLVWDPDLRLMTVLEERGGGVKATVDLMQAERLITTGLTEGVLYAVARDGRLLRLVPR